MIEEIQSIINESLRLKEESNVKMLQAEALAKKNDCYIENDKVKPNEKIMAIFIDFKYYSDYVSESGALYSSAYGFVRISEKGMDKFKSLFKKIGLTKKDDEDDYDNRNAICSEILYLFKKEVSDYEFSNCGYWIQNHDEIDDMIEFVPNGEFGKFEIPEMSEDVGYLNSGSYFEIKEVSLGEFSKNKLKIKETKFN